jgi:hypothetical protein
MQTKTKKLVLTIKPSLEKKIAPAHPCSLDDF